MYFILTPNIKSSYKFTYISLMDVFKRGWERVNREIQEDVF